MSRRLDLVRLWRLSSTPTTIITGYVLVMVYDGRTERRPLLDVKDRAYRDALGKPGDCFDMALLDVMSEWAGNYIEMLAEQDNAPDYWFIEHVMVEPLEPGEPDARD